MTNNEKFNLMVNRCKHPRAVLEAIRSLAPYIRETRTEQQRAKPLEELKEGAKEHEQCTDDTRSPDFGY